MATTPLYGLRYPVGTNAANLATWTGNLANDIEDLLTERIQYGNATVTGNGTNYATADVTFSVPFAVPPTVLVNTYNNGIYHAAVGDITTSGFRIFVANNTQANFSGSLTTRWVATGI